MPRRSYEPPQAPDAMTDTAFLHYLATVPAATVDEGMRALLLLYGPTSCWPTFEQRRTELIRRGAVNDRWGLEADQLLDKGSLAFMSRSLLRVPRSVSEWLSVPTGLGDRRYALKTCVGEGLLPYATEYESVTGGELVTLLTRMETRIEDPLDDTN
jgi:hypothetical protein